MAEIRGFWPFRHLRADAASHVLHFEGAALRRSGRGLAFWFRPWSASIAEVPLDDREVVLAFHGRTADFQDVLVQGTLTYRIVDPALAAQRVDFGIDTVRGTHLRTPLERVASALTLVAQQHALGAVQSAALKELLADGPGRLRDAIDRGFANAVLLHDLGIELVAVRAEPLRPQAEVERALEAPMRERIQEESDEAAFRRRALAVEKERAIQENELQNKIELAKRESDLIGRRGENARREAEEKVLAARIAATGDADRKHIDADARADVTRIVEGAALAIERERLAMQRETPPAVLFAIAAQEFATKLQRIEHLQVTPDMLSTLVSRIVSGGPELPAAKS